MLMLYNATGNVDIEIMTTWPRILLISLVCGGVELWEQLGDDNWTVPLTGAIGAYLLL